VGFAAVLAAPAVRAERVVLARGGQPAATIVVPAQANERETRAASELQHYVKAICGVELPLTQDGKRVSGTGLYIGRCEPSLDSDVPAKALNPETYALRVRGGRVFFAGRQPTPVYFAVVSFLQENLGVRWFAPGEEWEYVPTGKPGELTVDVKDVVSVPSTSPRIWSGHGWNEDWKTWELRNKVVISEVVPRRQFQNNVYRVFPPSQYGQTHPEYYPLIGGKRWIPSSDGDSAWRPCESNPEVQRLVVEHARQWFDAHPDVDSFSVGMDDISHLCGCENCRAWDPRPDSYEKGEFSDRHYKFVNAIAREIGKTHPDRYIGTLIYSIARKLPETVDQLEPNVFGYITETSAAWWDPALKAADHKLTREWAKRCQHLSRYDYYGFACMTPRVYPHHMAEQVKLDKSLGMEGMYTEVYTFLPHTAPMIYAFAKLQWDAKLDVDDLLGDFYARMFGPAAGTMKRYFALLERSYNTPRPGRRVWEHRDLPAQALTMSEADLDEGFGLLDRAQREADSDRIRQRIGVVEGGLRYGSYPIRTYGLSRQLQGMAVADEPSAQQALQMAPQIARLSHERQRFWEEAARREDLLGETVRGLMNNAYLQTGQAATVEGGSLVAALKALTWYTDKAPDKLAAVLDQVVSTTPEGELVQLVRGWREVFGGAPQNLFANGDFESQAPNVEQPEKDWQTAGAPPGWSVWSRDQRAVRRLAAGQGRSGVAATIRQAASAVYGQSIPVTEGERYLCLAWAKVDPPDRVGGARLVVRYNQKSGEWYEHHEKEPLVALQQGLAGWQPLVLVVTVPEGAARLVVLLHAENQEEGATALFDDVGVYRLPEP
jgi:hypothetical protein